MKLYKLALIFFFFSIVVSAPMAIGAVWFAVDGQWEYAALWGTVAILGAYFIKYYWGRYKYYKGTSW